MLQLYSQHASISTPGSFHSSQFDTPIGPLLITVFTSILEVILLCVAGYILAARGILDKRTRKQLNHLNVSLFTPSLLFSKVAFFLSPAKLRELWIIPIFFVVTTFVSMSVSYLLGTIFRLKKSQRSFAMAAAMFMNSNSLPIALMQSLVASVSGLKWGNDNQDAMLGRALTYLVLYSTLGMVLRWSYGVRLLAQADDRPMVIPVAPEADEHTPLASSFPDDYPRDRRPLPSSSTLAADDLDGDTLNQDSGRFKSHRHRRPPVPHRAKFYNSFPNSPNISTPELPTIDSGRLSPATSSSSDSDSDSENDALPTTRQLGTSPSLALPETGFRVLFRRSKQYVSRTCVAFNDFMTVPLWAALAALLVACIQPMQHALESHLQPVKSALAAAGDCSIPVTLIVLGAYFYPPPKEDEEGRIRKRAVTTKSSSSMSRHARELLHVQKLCRERAEKSSERAGETKTVVIAVASRMIITPLLLLPLMAMSTLFDLHAIFEDPVFVVSNVLLISSPPALTLAQITQAASGDAFERLISRTIFWAYCIVTPPATIFYVVMGLILSKL